MMLDNVLWVNIFGAKRGSTFVYNYLRQHPQVASQDDKEAIYNDRKYLMSNYYKLMLKRFEEGRTKVILDGSPSLPWLDEFSKIDQFIDSLGVKDAYFIYLFREPYKTLISKMTMCLVYNRTERLKRIMNGEFKFESLKILKIIESKFPRENIYICCIEDFLKDINKLFEFLGLDRKELDSNVYKHTNQDVLVNNIDSQRRYIGYKSLINRDNKIFSWVKEDYKLVDDEYGTNLIERYNL